MSGSDWHNRFGGKFWRYDQDGVYLQGPNGESILQRTSGSPLTMRKVWQLFGPVIQKVSTQFQVPPALIMMTIGTETGFARDVGFTGPKTFRWENGVKVTDVTPNYKGDYSAGPMQTLATTARWVIKTQHLNMDPFAAAPAINPKPATPPTDNPLYKPEINLLIGTAVIKQRWNNTGDDPVLVSAAFNAGSLRESSQNDWHLVTYGDHLDRAVAWYGDACAVLKENGIGG